jgi:hypothetical protein
MSWLQQLPNLQNTTMRRILRELRLPVNIEFIDLPDRFAKNASITRAFNGLVRTWIHFRRSRNGLRGRVSRSRPLESGSKVGEAMLS